MDALKHLFLNILTSENANMKIKVTVTLSYGNSTHYLN